jgi:hypothetical protein
MNIFCTNEDPVLAAQDLCDKHVVSKMIVEGSIMLAHCFPQDLLDHTSTPKTKTGESRKAGKGYYNHCCSVWARETKDNFNWLVQHTLEQCRERIYRWPKSEPHFTQTFIEWCNNNHHNTVITKTGLTPFAIAIQPQSTCRLVNGFDEMYPVEKYRNFIYYDKPFAQWTTRSAPDWYRNLREADRGRCVEHQCQLEHQAA